jgi:hypothetical protein
MQRKVRSGLQRSCICCCVAAVGFRAVDVVPAPLPGAVRAAATGQQALVLGPVCLAPLQLTMTRTHHSCQGYRLGHSSRYHEVAAQQIRAPHALLLVPGCTVVCRGAVTSFLLSMGRLPAPIVLKGSIVLALKLVCVAVPLAASAVIHCPQAVADSVQLPDGPPMHRAHYLDAAWCVSAVVCISCRQQIVHVA